MRLRLNFHTRDENKFPVNYRECIMSWIKHGLSNDGAFNYLVPVYGSGEPIQKTFTFAVRLPKSSFFSEYIQLSEKHFDMYLSVSNPSDAITLYNAFNGQRFKEFALPLENSCTLVNISMQQEKEIKTNEIVCQLAMPLAVREHDKVTNKDRWFIYSDADFQERLHDVVLAQIITAGLDKSLIDGFSCEPINCKKTVVRFKGAMIQSTLGIIKLNGNIELLRLLYQGGIGSKKSAGFGYLNIIN